MKEPDENREFIILFTFVALILILCCNILIINILYKQINYNKQIIEYNTNTIINEIRKIK